ncbi:CHASE2 domain-containing protein [Dongia sp.]|uniref:CHASE2 domain-containing protein n=1 Tax=Dongia sp. TaxID=1977262 RepID=UPI0035B27A2E
MTHLLHRLLPALILLATLGLRWEDPAFLSEMRLRIFDVFQRISPREYVPTPVKVIDIDDATLHRYGQWPWPRSQVADLIDRLGAAGAAVIAFDVVFAEPDRTAPRRAMMAWGFKPDDSIVSEVVGRTNDPDEVLAKSIEKAPVVLGFVLTGDDAPETLPKRKGGLAVTGGRKDLKLKDYVQPQFSSAVRNLPELQNAAQGLGAFNVTTQGDSIVRHLPLFFNGNGQLYPSLVAEALRVAQKASTMAVKASGAGGYQNWWQRLGRMLAKDEAIAEVRIGKINARTDGVGRVLLYDSGRKKARIISAWRVLAGEEIDLAGAILFVGTSAPGLLDLRSTPTESVTPGVEIHAQIAEQILTGISVNRPYWTILPELAFLLTVSATLVLLLPRLGPIGCAILGGGAVLVAFGAAWFAFIYHGQLFDPVYPGLSALFVFISGVLTSYFKSDVERRSVRDAFGHYLAPEMVERLAADPEQLRLGGELREVTILFCDIRDFTSIAERTDATRLTRLLNSFLTPMTDAILGHRGTIDKYIGDSIMAFWNAPLDDPDHDQHACAAALDMRRRLAQLNAQQGLAIGSEGASSEPLRMGIGINSGICLVGNLGSRQRFNYSVIGDDVNLAARLEALTKNYGIDILVADPGGKLADKFALLPLGEVLVKGKKMSTRVHALIGDAALAADPRFRLIATLLQETIAALGIGDTKAARHYLGQCPALESGADLEPFYAHIAQAIERREIERAALI